MLSQLNQPFRSNKPVDPAGIYDTSCRVILLLLAASSAPPSGGTFWYDRRVGGKAIKGIYDTWFNADEALQYWAKNSAWFVCDAKGVATCVKP